MEELSLIQRLVVFIVPLVFAITVHEAAHGWVASRLGDDTARKMGRVTLNPIPHIDLVGTILVPLGMYALGVLSGGPGFLFGWAKPVPVNPSRLRNIRRDSALVSLAGPASNFIMLLLWGLVIRIAVGLEMTYVSEPLVYMGLAGIMINAILMLLNLLPILPLDGGRVMAAILPPRLAMKYARLEPWGLFIIIGLLVSGLLWPILSPAMTAMHQLAFSIAGVT